MLKLRPAIAVLVIILSLAMLHLLIYTQIIQQGYDIDALNQKLARLRTETRKLNAEVARLEAPPRIEKIAREKLGMTFPEKIKYLTLSPRSPLPAVGQTGAVGKKPARVHPTPR